MSLHLPSDHSLDYWQDILPEISNIHIKESPKPEHLLNKSMDSDELFPEPRSLDSSEFSESSDDPTNNVWTSNEDTTLVEAVERNNNEWEVVAKSFPNASAEFVEKRWKKLNERKKKKVFTDEQDKLILSLNKTYGANWKKISAFFDGIGPNVIKKRFYDVLRPKVATLDEREKVELKSFTEKSIDEKLQTGVSKEVEDLGEKEKRSKLLELYQKMMEIEKYIKSTKTQIHELVVKSAK